MSGKIMKISFFVTLCLLYRGNEFNNFDIKMGMFEIIHNTTSRKSYCVRAIRETRTKRIVHI